MVKKRLHRIIKLLIISAVIFGCEKKFRNVDVKLLILTPDNYYDNPVVLKGKVHDVGAGGLWFILEDKTGFIQVTTENLSYQLSCLTEGQDVTLIGKLLQFEKLKYFSMISLLGCKI
ncbi:OB-fold nucleic acid binding domain-containing protein [Spirobacillus cienkowskii]|jgi:hypothetical protein|uniref:OB-fold nucleic acid binding domain-containing protein n=1 Tax=Spirobacillus cienkowskii TaxID=495820 RepID=UPI0030D50DB0